MRAVIVTSRATETVRKQFLLGCQQLDAECSIIHTGSAHQRARALLLGCAHLIKISNLHRPGCPPDATDRFSSLQAGLEGQLQASCPHTCISGATLRQSWKGGDGGRLSTSIKALLSAGHDQPAHTQLSAVLDHHPQHQEDPPKRTHPHQQPHQEAPPTPAGPTRRTLSSAVSSFTTRTSNDRPTQRAP